MRPAVVAAVALVLLSTACSNLPFIGSKNVASPSASATGPALAQASGQLDAEVLMPAGFPTDVPVYPKARLTAAAAFTSPGQTAWGMEWETMDNYYAVANYLDAQFNHGDWMRNPTASSTYSFTEAIARKSNPHVTGSFTINNDSGLTKILLSLVSPA
jgi:hypothetical protein